MLHPDRNKDDPNAEQQFMDLNWCKETLMDKKKRSVLYKINYTTGSPYKNHYLTITFGSGAYRGNF